MMGITQTPDMNLSNLLMAGLLGNKTTKKYRAALYLRLSRDDGNSNSESMSIKSQRDMLAAYADSNDYEVVDTYVDDGYSGTNFNRPNFMKMIQDIKLGRINMVITKDLSRLGRNHLEVGQYTEHFFPENGVRFIAINDNIDTENEHNDIAPFLNIVNDWYARDISKKIRSSRKIAAQKGWFMGSNEPYGYKRHPDNKHLLIVDEYAANIVKRIYEMYKSRESARHIADVLNREGILPPQAYYYERTGQDNPYTKSSKQWGAETISSILKKEVYLGHIVQNKRGRHSYKSKQMKDLPEAMWTVVENTHEAIVCKELWNEVQSLLGKNKGSKPQKSKITSGEEVSLFTNILFCKCCGSKMTFGSTKRSASVDYYYRCDKYVHKGSHMCTPHRIKLDRIYQIVLEDISTNARLAADDEEAFIRKLYHINMKEQKSESSIITKQSDKLQKRHDEINILVQKTFEKNVAGILDDETFSNLLNGYKAERADIEVKLNDYRLQLLQIESQTTDIEAEVTKLKELARVKTLTRKLVTSLIQSIHISEPQKIDGEKTYEIEIRYRFQRREMIERDAATFNATTYDASAHDGTTCA